MFKINEEINAINENGEDNKEIKEDIKKSGKSIFAKLTLAVVITFLLVCATALSTVKVVDYRESVLIEQNRDEFINTVEDHIGTENFKQLDHIVERTITTFTYYKKDGTIILKKEEVSESTTNFNQ